MSLKFSFNAGPSGDHHHDDGHGHGADVPGIPLPFAGAASTTSSSSVLEMRVVVDDAGVSCDGLSGDGVSYARATVAFAGRETDQLAAAVRSAIARTGATLPEPLIDSVTGIVLDLGGAEEGVLAALGLAVSPDAQQLATVDAALQARTGISAGTPIRRDEPAQEA